MNRRSLFRALGAAMMAAPAVAAATRSVPPQPAPAPLLRPVPTSPHGPWVGAHTHGVTDPGHSHSLYGYGASIHNHHVHHAGYWQVPGAAQ